MAVSARAVGAGTDHRALLRELLQHHGADGPLSQVLSVYVDLDPRDFATASARKSQLAALFEQAQRTAPDTGWRDTIERLRAQFEAADYAVEDAHALAIFCSGDGELMELLRLPRPVRPRAEFGATARIRPLVEALPASSWCVVLANGRCGRIFLGDEDQLVEAATIRTDPASILDEGGFGEASEERERTALEHAERVADAVRQLCEECTFEQLAIAAPAPMDAMIDHALHPDVRARVYAWFSADVDNVNASEVTRLVAPLAERWRDEREAQLFDRLRQFAGQRGAAALGLDQVLAALDEARVETLVVGEGFWHGGSMCQECGHLSSHQAHAECPVDAGAMYPCRDVVEIAVERAVLTSAHVCTVRRGGDDIAPRFTELEGYGGIAAVLRYGQVPGETT